MRPADRADDADRALRELGELADFVTFDVDVLRDMAIRHDHQMTGVVGIQVEHGVDLFATCDDQSVFVALPWNHAERAVVRVLGFAGRFVLAGDIGHPVRRPEPVKCLRLAV